MPALRRRADGDRAHRLRTVLLAGLTAGLCAALLAPSIAYAARCPRGTQREVVRKGPERGRYCVLRSGKHAGKRHGAFRRTWSNGRTRARGRYRHGRLHGKWASFHRNKRRHERGAYLRGERHGAWRAWKPSGGKKAEGRYVRGKREGLWTFWFRNSSDRGRYRGGRKDGAWVTTVYAGGQKTEHYDAGRRHGLFLDVAADGTELREARYEHGQPVGTWKGRWPDGSRRFEGSFGASGEEGVWTRWHRSGGRYEETTWQAGRRHGPYRRWDADGTLRVQGSFERGERDGRWQTFFPRAGEAAPRPHSDGVYRDGARHGLWREWDRRGRLLSETEYQHGTLHGLRKRYVAGRLVAEQVFVDGVAADSPDPQAPRAHAAPNDQRRRPPGRKTPAPAVQQGAAKRR